MARKVASAKAELAKETAAAAAAGGGGGVGASAPHGGKRAKRE